MVRMYMYIQKEARIRLRSLKHHLRKIPPLKQRLGSLTLCYKVMQIFSTMNSLVFFLFVIFETNVLLFGASIFLLVHALFLIS